MKLTKSRLKHIIKEELQKVLQEAWPWDSPVKDATEEAAAAAAYEERTGTSLSADVAAQGKEDRAAKKAERMRCKLRVDKLYNEAAAAFKAGTPASENDAFRSLKANVRNRGLKPEPFGPDWAQGKPVLQPTLRKAIRGGPTAPPQPAVLHPSGHCTPWKKGYLSAQRLRDLCAKDNMPEACQYAKALYKSSGGRFGL